MRWKKICVYLTCLIFLLSFPGCSGDQNDGNFIDNIIGKVVDMLLGEAPSDTTSDKETGVAESDSLADDWGDAEGDRAGVADWDDESDWYEEGEYKAPSEPVTTETLASESITTPNQPTVAPVTPPPTTVDEDEEWEESAEDDSSIEESFGDADMEGDDEFDEGGPDENQPSITELLESQKAQKQKGVKRDYHRIRNPFDFDPNNVIEPPPVIVDEPPLQPVQLNVSLQGIMMSRDADRRVAIIKGEDGKGYFLHIGDKIKGLIVEDIQLDHVIFLQKEFRQELRQRLDLKKDEGS